MQNSSEQSLTKFTTNNLINNSNKTTRDDKRVRYIDSETHLLSRYKIQGLKNHSSDILAEKQFYDLEFSRMSALIIIFFFVLFFISYIDKRRNS